MNSIRFRFWGLLFKFWYRLGEYSGRRAQGCVDRMPWSKPKKEAQP